MHDYINCQPTYTIFKKTQGMLSFNTFDTYLKLFIWRLEFCFDMNFSENLQLWSR